MTFPVTPSRAEQAKYARRLIQDITALEAERNLAVYELDARMVARWLLEVVTFSGSFPLSKPAQKAVLSGTAPGAAQCPVADPTKESK